MGDIIIKTMGMGEYGGYKTDPTAPYGIFVPNIHSSHLIVYFGSYNGEFRGNQTVQATNSNGLFVRSAPANWYLDVDHVMGSTPIAVADTLSTFISTQRHINTVTLAGFSMGAYAALLYSTFMPCVNVVTASAAQTKFPDYPVLGVTPVCPEQLIAFTSIKRLWELYGPPNAIVRLQCCAVELDGEDFNDIRDARELELFNCVRIKTYDCVGHKQLDGPLLRDNYNQKFTI
jgi:hypothetical protein